MTYKLFSSTIALATLTAFIGLPPVAQAQLKPSVLIAQQNYYTPRIDSFRVNPVNRLSPGTELVFTLQGTPNSQATVTIGNIVQSLPMREVEPGYYEGRYTIRNADQITDNSFVRASLQRGNLTANARLQQPLTMASDGYGNSNTAQSLFIDRFTVQPIQQLEPGAELNFTLIGAPNARASFSINGVTYNQPMRETSRGVYQGQYVVRRQDYFPASGTTVTASLQAGNQLVRARLDQNLVASNGSNTNTSTNQIPLEILSPQNNSQVSGTVEVRGKSAPNATVDVSVQAKTSLAGLIGFNRNVFSRTIEADSQGNFSFSFQPVISVPGTQYQVSLNATKGNQTNEETLVLVQR